jgi:hypothetical protein
MVARIVGLMSKTGLHGGSQAKASKHQGCAVRPRSREHVSVPDFWERKMIMKGRGSGMDQLSGLPIGFSSRFTEAFAMRGLLAHAKAS